MRAILFLVAFMFVAKASAAGMITVYYIPLTTTTYLPVTADSIECDAHEIWSIDEKTEYGKNLLALAKKATQSTIEAKAIRAKIVFPDTTILIDTHGGAASNEAAYQFNPDEIRRFREKLPLVFIKDLSKQSCSRSQ